MTVDEIVSTYELDATKYELGVKRVEAAGAKLGLHATALGKDWSDAFDPVRGIGTSVATVLGVATAGVVAFGTALAGMTSVTSSKAAEFDAMVKALEAIEGSSKKAADAMADLRKIAELPGLGFGEAIGGYTQLRRAKMSPEEAKRVLEASGNANALAGGGRAELDQITRAIMQIRMTPNINGQDLMQLTTAGVPAQSILKDAFGTFDSDELKKKGIGGKEAVEELVKAMEKMPKAGNSVKNSLENMQMGIEQAMVSIGLGLSTTLIPMAADLGSVLDELDKNGSFKAFGDTIGSLIGQITGLDQGPDSIKGAMIDFSAAVVGATAGLRNMSENIQNWFEVDKFARDWVQELVTRGMRNQAGSSGDTGPADNSIDLSPYGEAQRFRDVLEAEANLRRIRARNKAKKDAAAAAAAGNPPPDDPLKAGGKGNDYKNLLAEIADNTKPIRDMRDIMLGGGALTGRGISKQELANIDGRHGRHPGDRITRLVFALSDEIRQAMIESQDFSRREV